MPRFAANISLLFTEFPYAERFGAAAEAGFEGVEVLFPYEHAAKETTRPLLTHGLPMVLMNAPPPNYTGGEPGWAAAPDDVARFRSDMGRVLRFAEAVKPQMIHVMSGPGEGEAAAKTFADNLAWLADQAPQQRFNIEPLNPYDFPGYFLNDYDLAADLLARIDRPNVALQYDSLHAQRINGDALGTWERFKHLSAHVQISQSPDRSEPGPGEVDFAALFEAILASGYDGWISAEYRPRGDTTLEGLGWLAAAQSAFSETG